MATARPAHGARARRPVGYPWRRRARRRSGRPPAGAGQGASGTASGGHSDRRHSGREHLALARQMYESREFSAMPVLADALQDAGCDSDDVLKHCREAGAVHVRGCWVVDLVLGKE